MVVGQAKAHHKGQATHCSPVAVVVVGVAGKGWELRAVGTGEEQAVAGFVDWDRWDLADLPRGRGTWHGPSWVIQAAVK